MAKKKNNIKLDNAGGVIYTAMKKSKIRNPRFKPAFVATLPRANNYSKSVACLLKKYKETGSLKCSCCDSSEAYFVFHVQDGRATFRAMVDVNGKARSLTVDHDLLKSLGGTDSEANYNPLCYNCNQIRGSRFAEFKEFKEWYDSQAFIDTIAGLPTANFCHVDFTQNLNNASHFETMQGASSLPNSVMNTLRKEIRQQHYDLFSKLSIKVWLKMDRDFANKTLNELVLDRVHNRHQKRFIEVQNHNFFNYPKNMCDHRKIKLHIEGQLVAQIRKLRNMQPEVVTEEVKETNVSFFTKFMGAVRKIFA
jgi:hypothetical protein